MMNILKFVFQHKVWKYITIITNKLTNFQYNEAFVTLDFKTSKNFKHFIELRSINARNL